MFDDEGPKDWEIQDEEPPEALKRKWEEEEARGFRTVVCASCKKETPAENLTCIFCGTDLGTSISRDNGSLSCFLSWIKRLFKKG